MESVVRKTIVPLFVVFALVTVSLDAGGTKNATGSVKKKADVAKAELKKLQGTWKMVKMEVGRPPKW